MIFSYQISTLSHDKGELKLARLALIHFINLYVEARANTSHFAMTPIDDISTLTNQFVGILMLEWNPTQLVYKLAQIRLLHWPDQVHLSLMLERSRCKQNNSTNYNCHPTK